MNRNSIKKIFINPEDTTTLRTEVNNGLNSEIKTLFSEQNEGGGGVFTQERLVEKLQSLREEADIRSKEQEYVPSGLLDNSGTPFEKIKEQIRLLRMRILVILVALGLLGKDTAFNLRYNTLDDDEIKKQIGKIESTRIKNIVSLMLKETEIMKSISEDELKIGKDLMLDIFLQKKVYLSERIEVMKNILDNLPSIRNLHGVKKTVLEEYSQLYIQARKEKIKLQKTFNALDVYINTHKELEEIESEISTTSSEITNTEQQLTTQFQFTDKKNIVLTQLEEAKLIDDIQKGISPLSKMLKRMELKKTLLHIKIIDSKLALLGINQTKILSKQYNNHDEHIFVKKDGDQDVYCKVTTSYQQGDFFITPLQKESTTSILMKEEAEVRDSIIKILQNYTRNNNDNGNLLAWDEEQIQFAESTNGNILLNYDGTINYLNSGKQYITILTPSEMQNNIPPKENRNCNIPSQYLNLAEVKSIHNETDCSFLNSPEDFLKLLGKNQKEISKNLDILFKNHYCNGFGNNSFKTMIKTEKKYLCFGPHHSLTQVVNVLVRNSEDGEANFELLDNLNLFVYLVGKNQ